MKLLEIQYFPLTVGMGKHGGNLGEQEPSPSPPHLPHVQTWGDGSFLPASQEDSLHLCYSFYKKPVIQQASCFSEACEPV